MSIRVYVFNDYTNSFESYYLGLNDTLPYVTNDTLKVKEFRGSSSSTVLWTHRKFMEAWNTLRTAWGKSIYVPFAFKRIWEGGHSYQSQHYAGVAIDCGQNLN